MKINYLRFLFLTFFISICFMKNASGQTIDSVSNNSGMQGQTLDVVISGNNTNFGQGTSTTQVWLSQGSTQILANTVIVNSATEIIANITLPIVAPPGLYNINTYESVDNQLVLANGFNIIPLNRSIVSIEADSAFEGQTLNVVITGNNTSFGQGTSTTQVWLSQGSTQIFANSVIVNSATEVIANITLPLFSPAGPYNVNTFESIDDHLILSNGFNLLPLTSGIVSAQADSAVQGQTLNVVITGNNTNFGQGTSTTQIWLSQGSTLITANSVTATSPTEAIANFSFPASGPTGLFNVNSYNSIDGQLTLTNGFNLIPLDTSISAIGIGSGAQGQTLDMVITGYSTSFGLGRSAPQVWLSKGATTITANSVTVNSTSEIIANFTIPALAPLGLYDVNVYGSIDGLLVLTNGFILKSVTTEIDESQNSIASGKAYPNPFSNSLKLDYSIDRSSSVQITLFDISGRIISNTSTTKTAGDHTFEFDANSLELPAGVYFIRLTTDEKNYNFKVIRQ